MVEHHRTGTWAGGLAVGIVIGACCLAFSASASSKIVVPTKGSVPFVLFVPSQPLEQACWLDTNFNISQVHSVYDGGIVPGIACDGQGGWSTKAVPFRKWTSMQLQAFENYAYVVVAGMHIKEAKDEQASAKALACPENNDGGWAIPAKVAAPSAPAPNPAAAPAAQHRKRSSP